jgi:type I restriction enzyme S subunit
MKYRLGDICTITKGETGIMKAIPGAYTMVALGEANKTHNEFQFDTKAVIIPLVSSTGHGHASMKRVKYQEGKFALGSILCAVIPKDEKIVLAKYLHIYLHWNREELLVSQMKGMANVSLPMNKIADVFVTVPSIEKQQEIIDLEVQLVEKELSVEKLLSDQLTQLENLNQAILQEAVQGKLVKQDKKDEPASELLKRIKAEKAKSGKKEKPFPTIKAEEIPFEIPENWVWCRLGEIIQLISGQDLKPSEYNSKNIGIPYITGASHFNDGVLEISRWTPAPKSISNLRDLLITCKGTIGAMAFNEIGEIHIARQIMAIRNSYGVEISFVKYFLSQHIERLLELAKSLIPGISRDNILLVKFPLPPLSEQKRIVEEIERQLAKTKQLKEHVIANQQATEQLLKALLHQAFEVEEMEEV